MFQKTTNGTLILEKARKKNTNKVLTYLTSSKSGNKFILYLLFARELNAWYFIIYTLTASHEIACVEFDKKSFSKTKSNLNYFLIN